jgi:hypothetical protein
MARFQGSVTTSITVMRAVAPVHTPIPTSTSRSELSPPRADPRPGGDPQDPWFGERVAADPLDDGPRDPEGSAGEEGTGDTRESRVEHEGDPRPGGATDPVGEVAEQYPGVSCQHPAQGGSDEESRCDRRDHDEPALASETRRGARWFWGASRIAEATGHPDQDGRAEYRGNDPGGHFHPTLPAEEGAQQDVGGEDHEDPGETSEGEQDQVATDLGESRCPQSDQRRSCQTDEAERPGNGNRTRGEEDGQYHEHGTCRADPDTENRGRVVTQCEEIKTARGKHAAEHTDHDWGEGDRGRRPGVLGQPYPHWKASL